MMGPRTINQQCKNKNQLTNNTVNTTSYTWPSGKQTQNLTKTLEGLKPRIRLDWNKTYLIKLNSKTKD